MLSKQERALIMDGRLDYSLARGEKSVYTHHLTAIGSKPQHCPSLAESRVQNRRAQGAQPVRQVSSGTRCRRSRDVRQL